MSRQATFLLQRIGIACLISLSSVSPLRCAAQTPDLGAGASLHGKPLFPPDNPWNQDISQMPVDPNSANLLASIGLNTGLHPDFGTVFNGAPNGIPYIVVPGSQARVPVSFDYADESDPGPYPIPSNAPIEGGPNSSGDRHVLVIDRDNWILYELFAAYPSPDFSSWTAGSGAVFNLNSDLMRPEGWTSADAAGLPIFPGLVRYDEVYEQKAILHALRFTVQNSRRGFVYPARHFASSITDANYPPMGMRVRLKASFDISGFPASVQVILTALKKYGMMVADNGSNWFISGAPDSRWNDSELHTLSGVLGSDFEVVQMGDVTSDTLNPPSGLQASAGNATVSLSWTAVSGATGYNVKRALQSGGPYTSLSPVAGTGGYTDTGLTNGQTYYYVVSARNAGVQSYDSTEVSATPATTSLASATFVSTDTSTQGNWKGVYGKDGYNVVDNAISYPAYARVSLSGQGDYVWDASTSDPRALQKAGTATDYIASCLYSSTSFTLDVNLTDGQAHQVSLYGLDWDAINRSERIDIVDAVSGALLDSRSLSAFSNGTYLTWRIQGHVQIKLTNLASANNNAVLSGIFFDAPSTSTASATFVSTDTSTQGNWKGVYGKDGYNVVDNAISYPAYARVSLSGQGDYVWDASTSDPRALQKAGTATDYIASCLYSSTSFTLDVNLTDGQAHQVSLYGLDWDAINRSERIDIVDAVSGALLDSRSLSAFSNGTYLTWRIQGHVQIKLTNLASANNNAVFSGIFFDAPSTSTASATFVSTDTSTQGNWKGVYGKDGYNVVDNAISYPAYARVSLSGQGDYVWDASTSDPRALQKAGTATDYIASCLYSSTSFTLDVNLTDGQAHQVSLYGLDWDAINRSERIDIVDAVSGALLDSRSLSAFSNGTYLTWRIQGHVQIKLTNLASANNNAVLSGIFF